MEDPPLHRGRPSERLRLLASVGISLLAISAAVAICWLLVAGATADRRAHSSDCLVRDAHKLPALLSQTDQLKLASGDFRVLVRLSGFLEYLNEEAGGTTEFLPLKLANLSLSSAGDGLSRLTLWAQCARLTLHLASDARQLIVGSLEVEASRAGLHERTCQVMDTAIKLDDFVRSHYLCTRPTRYECKSSHWQNNNTVRLKTIATLELTVLEFELDGEPTVLRTNQFGKPPAECH